MTARAVPSARRRSSALRRVVRRFGGWEAFVGVLIVAAIVAIAILAPLIAPHDPESVSSDRILAAPNLQHPFGSDSLGRDVLTRVIYAFRVSLLVAIGSVGVAFAVGAPIGLTAGFRGGWVDGLLMRLVDIVLAVPGLLFAIGVAALLGRSLTSVMIAIAVVNVPIFARLLRGAVLAQKQNDFVLAARAVGVRPRSILVSHVLPNAISPVIVQGTLALATAIIDAAGLGFLGLGPQDPSTPEWGTMLTDTVRYLQSAPHLALAPGIAIVISVLGFNLIGDGLREALDPKLRGRA